MSQARQTGWKASTEGMDLGRLSGYACGDLGNAEHDIQQQHEENRCSCRQHTVELVCWHSLRRAFYRSIEFLLCRQHDWQGSKTVREADVCRYGGASRDALVRSASRSSQKRRSSFSWIACHKAPHGRLRGAGTNSGARGRSRLIPGRVCHVRAVGDARASCRARSQCDAGLL
jgi:hypothetical protein